MATSGSKAQEHKKQKTKWRSHSSLRGVQALLDELELPQERARLFEAALFLPREGPERSAAVFLRGREEG